MSRKSHSVKAERLKSLNFPMLNNKQIVKADVN